MQILLVIFGCISAHGRFWTNPRHDRQYLEAIPRQDVHFLCVPGRGTQNYNVYISDDSDDEGLPEMPQPARTIFEGMSAEELIELRDIRALDNIRRRFEAYQNSGHNVRRLLESCPTGTRFVGDVVQPQEKESSWFDNFLGALGKAFTSSRFSGVQNY